jgi:hypothetical protein
MTVAHQVEHGLLGDGGDAPAHLAKHHDPNRRHDEHPDQGIAEGRAGLGGKDELADVDEAADRGHECRASAQADSRLSSICLSLSE